MKKTYLQDIIEKYHLGGLVEKVKIIINNKILTTKFISDKKNLVGNIEAPGFELEDCEFGIYNTSYLLKLINITNVDIELNIEKKGKVFTKLLIKDEEFNVEYTLADIMLTPAIPTIEEPNYEMVVNIDKDFITKFSKAKKALDTEIFTVEQTYKDGNPVMKFIIGGIEGYTNKVSFDFPTSVSSVPGAVIKFPINEFNEILINNREFESGILNVSEQGLLKLEFVTKDNIKISYVLVGKE